MCDTIVNDNDSATLVRIKAAHDIVSRNFPTIKILNKTDLGGDGFHFEIEAGKIIP